MTPLERPVHEGTNLLLTKKEAKTIERRERDRLAERASPGDPNRVAPAAGGSPIENTYWFESGLSAAKVNGQYRTSIIVDPADGRIPPQLPEARERNTGARGTFVRARSWATEAHQPLDPEPSDIELRPIDERCLFGFNSTSGPPTLPNYFYNNFKQIVQTPDYVMILAEMVHDVRIVPLNRGHVPANIKNWSGDSIGRWEGDTLVVETTNFTNKTRFRGSSENMKVIERFRRTDRNTLLYRFTIDDPSTWSRPWTGEYPWIATDERIFEYACHEGNYAIGSILKGARLLEAEREKRVTEP